MRILKVIEENIRIIGFVVVLILILVGLLCSPAGREVPVEAEFSYEFQQDYERIKISNISEQRADTVDMFISFKSKSDSNIVEINKKIYFDETNEKILAFDDIDIQKMSMSDKSNINVQLKNPIVFEFGIWECLKYGSIIIIVVILIIFGISIIIDVFSWILKR